MCIDTIPNNLYQLHKKDASHSQALHRYGCYLQPKIDILEQVKRVTCLSKARSGSKQICIHISTPFCRAVFQALFLSLSETSIHMVSKANTLTKRDHTPYLHEGMKHCARKRFKNIPIQARSYCLIQKPL